MEFMEINGKIYVFKFGLKGLILLSKLPKIDVEKNFKYVVFAGLLSDNPNITLREVEALISEMNEEQLNSLKVFAKIFLLSLNELEVAELYAKAVGEIGIQPSDFYSMSVEEINWAYEGYLRKKEVEANLTMTAINYSKANEKELIRLTEDKGYELGSMEERRATFEALGIEVKE